MNAGRSPLQIIQQDVLEGQISTTRLLEKVLVLGGQIGSDELRAWARRESLGYVVAEDDIPSYRRITAQLTIDGVAGFNLIRGQGIWPESLPDFVREAGVGNEVRFGQSIGELEALAQGDEPLQLHLPDSHMIAAFMNRENPDGGEIHAVYWKVLPKTVQGVVDRIRSALADLISELAQAAPAADGLPTPERASQAVHLTLTGDNSGSITLNTSSAAGGSTSSSSSAPSTKEEKESWWRRLRSKGVVFTLIAAVGSCAGILNYLHWFPFS